jgi:hypothetical protein
MATRTMTFQHSHHHSMIGPIVVIDLWAAASPEASGEYFYTKWHVLVLAARNLYTLHITLYLLLQSPPPSRSRSRSRSESPRDNMRRRRPSWSPHRGSDRKRPIKNNTRRSPSRSPSPPVRNDRPPIPRSHSPPQGIDSKEDKGKWRKRQSPSRNLQIREREGNDGRWRRDRWNNDRQVKSRSRSRSRSGPRRSPRRGRKRKGDRSSRSKS